MRSGRSIRGTVLLCTLLVVAAPARAQDFSVFVDNSLATLNAHIAASEMERSQRQAAPATQARSPASENPTLTYIPSKERRTANVAAFVAKARETGGAGAALLERLTARADVIDLMDREMRKVGLSSTNVADAYAGWWVNSWLASEGRTGGVSAAAMRAVKAQAERAIAATPDVARLDDAGKQEFAEGLMVQSLLAAALTRQAVSDPARTRALGAATRESGRAMGLDLASMVLTEEGLRPRQGSDAGGSLPAAPGGGRE